MQQILKRDYIVGLQQAGRVFVETQDSFSDYCFETGSVDGVLLDYGVHCAEDQ